MRAVGVRVEWVSYGRPAADALRQAIEEAKGDDPLAPVSVIVPSNHVGVGTRRLLASGVLGPVSRRGTGVAAVTFLTVYRLAERLGSPVLAGAGRRPVSTPVIAAALRSALAEQPGVFAPVADHPATETALVTAYRELRDVSDEGLDALARRSSRAADVVRLHRAARAGLAPRWYDEEDLMAAAVSVLSAAALGDLGAVVVYLPERLSRHGAELLGAVAGAGELTVLAGSSGDGQADAEVELSVGRLVAAGGKAPDLFSTVRPAVHPMAVVGADRTVITTVSDGDEEVRAAVRAVVDATLQGTPLDRIAILHASPEPYARLAYEQLAAAGVAMNGASVMPLSARVAGRTLLGMLALPGAGYRREDVLAWLAGARLRHEDHWISVTAWERISRQAGVVAGRSQWDGLLARVAADHEAEAQKAEADPEAPPWKVERAKEQAGRARELRSFVLGLIDDLSAAAARPVSWAARARWAQDHLTRLLGGPSRRGGWPMAEQKAAERVEQALDRLGCLDEVGGPVDLDVFGRTLELELEADLGRVGRMGEGVLVGPVSMGVGLDLDLVVVLGLAEGTFPSPTQDDSLLPDHERLATGDQLPLRAGRIGRQHRELLAALAGAGRQLLCVPRGDLRRSQERVPSRWVLDIASHLAGQRWWSDELLGHDREWLVHVASFDAGLRRVDFPSGEQEYRLRSLMAAASVGLDAGMLATLGDGILDGGAAVVGARRSDRFTRFDGNLGGSAVPSPTDRTTSATRLELWAGCPFRYLMQNILNVAEVENPEDELEITPKDRGSLVHEALELFIAAVLERPAADRPGPDDGWTPADRDLMRRVADDVCGRWAAQGKTGRAIFWQRDRRRIEADLQRLLDLDDIDRARHRTRPVAAELAFGMAGSELATVALALPDGRTVHFRGFADRVDEADDGSLHVMDYKTGGTSSYQGLSADNPDQGGRRLQLAVYGQAARMFGGNPEAAVLSEYWFASTKGKFARIGYQVTPEILDRIGHTLATVVGGIEAGVFPSFSRATSTTPFVECPYCDPDGLGVVDLGRAWERKRADPALAVFAGLAEPELEGDDSDEGPDG
jgi:ATP-dependent helicase/nuclease subunit B